MALLRHFQSRKALEHTLRALRPFFSLLNRSFISSFRSQISLCISKTMASVTGASVSISSLSSSFRPNLAPARRISNVRLTLFSINEKRFPSLRMQSRRFQVSCAAKPETVDKVCEIVKKQLALSDDSAVSGESKFAALGADSLDTVEIVMGLEEEFGISVEEESAQNISTVQDAADLIETLLEKK